MKIGIFGRVTENTDFDLLEEFLQFLISKEIPYRIQAEYGKSLQMKMSNWPSSVEPFLMENMNDWHPFDFAYSMGGDGTLLNTVLDLGARQVPVIGVNFGRLGFLTSVREDQMISTTEDILKDIYKIDARCAIEVESSPAGLFGELNFGLNDLTIHKANTNEMITVHTYVNGEFLNSYWGDGLIIATPTGSTAYSLSCGGPIIHPHANAFVITPVAPHSLTVRPVIIPDHYVISFEIESRSGQAMVALDTRTKLVNEKVDIAIRKADFDVKLVRAETGNYLDMLRERLMWGRDSRN